MKTDVLIIGSGLAGITAATTAASKGLNVIVVTKTPEILAGSSRYAQGGIIYKGQDDSPQKLIDDIMVAGDGISYEPAARQLAEMGPELMEKIAIGDYKVNFDKNESGKYDLTMEGAHSNHRIVHYKDITGYAIHKAAIDFALKQSNIKFLSDHTAIDLLTLSHHSKDLTDIYQKPACFGAYVLNNVTGEVFPIFANNTILASGGIGQVYLHSSNPKEATGDGLALAWRAGARCFNLQYVQFHPTTLFVDNDRFLISESLRGEGAKLYDVHGNEFMHRFHEQKELAPRDIVARAIHQTMQDTESDCVYLNISHKNSDWIKDRFPGIYAKCFEKGVDITKEPIPVVPAAHYFCGGVGVNLNGRTSLRRLYAVGEVSCTGLHGANRLASTSLLECLVWGYNAGVDVANTKEEDNYFPPMYDWKNENEEIDPALITQDWQTIKYTMWNYVGLVRTTQRLRRARTSLRHLQSEIEDFYKKAKMTRSIVQLRNGVQAALAITDATLQAKQSKGAHYLKD